LKEIDAEKKRLVKEGKIKEQKSLSVIKPEVPFELPKGWEWVRFVDVVEISSGVTKGRKLNCRQ
jgi:type I restriction enzyme S subunit